MARLKFQPSRSLKRWRNHWSWREELNLQPVVYKTTALPLSYASPEWHSRLYGSSAASPTRQVLRSSSLAAKPLRMKLHHRTSRFSSSFSSRSNARSAF